MCGQQSLRSACTCVQSDQSLCKSLDYSMTVKLLTEHHFEFLSLKRGYTGSSESTLVRMPHCWKSHARAQLVNRAAIIGYVLKFVGRVVLSLQLSERWPCQLDEICFTRGKYWAGPF